MVRISLKISDKAGCVLRKGYLESYRLPPYECTVSLSYPVKSTVTGHIHFHNTKMQRVKAAQQVHQRVTLLWILWVDY